MQLRKIIAPALCLVSLLAVPAAQAFTLGELGNSQPSSVFVANNSGGNIANFAVEAAGYRSAGTHLKFTGRCDSACTLFLGLPSEQTCVSVGAYFRFHSPTASSSRSEHLAQNYLMRSYPGWVRSWIAQHHGLSHTLITMDYDVVSRHMPTCSTIAIR